MKHIVFLLLTTSFVALPISSYDVAAKSFRASHGVAFNKDKFDFEGFDSIETASGDEIAHDLKDGPVSHVAEAPQPDEPLPSVIETAQSPVIEDVQETPVAEAAPTPSKIATDECTQKGAAHKSFYSFYYPSLATIEKTANGYVIKTSGGTAQYNGALYALRSVEVLSLNSMQIKLTHQNDDGGQLVVVVPVIAGAADDQGIAMVMGGAKSQYMDIADFVPVSHDYNECADGGIITLSHPIEFSSGQIAKFKSLL